MSSRFPSQSKSESREHVRETRRASGIARRQVRNAFSEDLACTVLIPAQEATNLHDESKCFTHTRQVLQGPSIATMNPRGPAPAKRTRGFRRFEMNEKRYELVRVFDLI